MSLSTPAPFAVRLANIASRLGAFLTADGVNKDVCEEVASELEKLCGEVDGSARSVEEVEDAQRVITSSVARIRRGGNGLQIEATANVLADLNHLLSRLVRPAQPALPTEILHHILDCLKADLSSRFESYKEIRPTFVRCTLVHSSWTTYARRVVFEHSYASSVGRVVRLERLLKANPGLQIFIKSLSLASFNFQNADAPIRALFVRLPELHRLYLEGSGTFCPTWLQGLKELRTLKVEVQLSSDPLPPLSSLQYLTVLQHDNWETRGNLSSNLPSLISLETDSLGHSFPLPLINPPNNLLINSLRYLSIEFVDDMQQDDYSILSDLLPRIVELRCLRLGHYSYRRIIDNLYSQLPPRLSLLHLFTDHGHEDLLGDVASLVLQAIARKLIPLTLRQIALETNPVDLTDLHDDEGEPVDWEHFLEVTRAHDVNDDFVRGTWNSEKMEEKYGGRE